MGCFHIVHVYDMMIGHKDELCCGNIILDLRGSVYHLGPVDDSTDGCSETREFDWYNPRDAQRDVTCSEERQNVPL